MVWLLTLLCIAVFILYAVWLWFWKRRNNEGKAHPLRCSLLTVAAILLGVLVLECTVFNVRHWKSLSSPPVEDYRVTVEGFEQVGEDWYLEEGNGWVTVTPEAGGQKIDNLYLAIAPDVHPDVLIQKNRVPKNAYCVPVTLSLQDEGNSVYYQLPTVQVVKGVPGTSYIRLHPSGKVTGIKIAVRCAANVPLVLTDIGVNPVVPFAFSWLRLLGFFLPAAAVYLLRPGSAVYRYGVNIRSRTQWLALGLVCMLCAAMLLPFIYLNLYSRGELAGHRDQYEQMAKMLAKGQLHFDYQASQELQALPNIYDAQARRDLGSDAMRDVRTGHGLWDHAYFEGNFYMYFGVVPAVLLYLPYLLVTGSTLPNVWVHTFLNILFILAVPLLLYMLVRRYYPQTRFAHFLLLVMVITLSCGSVFVKYATMYMIPMVSGMVLGMLGLSLWLLSMKGNALRRGPLALGSLCMALIFGCRPTMGLACLLGIPLFWQHITRHRTLLSKKGLGNTLCIALPVVAVAALLMAYNGKRFGSPLEFGAQYNLTVNDMTHLGLVWERLPFGLFTLFFQLPVVTVCFPFISGTQTVNAYQGIQYAPSTFGGAFFIAPILLLIPLMWKERKTLKEKGLWGFCVTCAGLSVVISCIDIQVAGMDFRYTQDFMWLLLICAAIGLMHYGSRIVRPGSARLFRGLVCGLGMAGICFSLCYLVAPENSFGIDETAPVTYYSLQQLFAF